VFQFHKYGYISEKVVKVGEIAVVGDFAGNHTSYALTERKYYREVIERYHDFMNMTTDTDEFNRIEAEYL
jgi:hypothetical protein